jgi:gentisate 1,2-dioxygenase
MSTAFYIKPETTAERREFYERLDQKNTAPLWEALARLVTPEPRPAAVPALWRYRELRPLLMEAGRLITAKEAERRVLVLENPGLRGMSQVTGSLYAGLQLVLPGEITSTHRHVACALRFIVEGTGAYTAVEGERTTMHPGDFILTPSWSWHDHGNPSSEPVVWLDGLDVPIVNLFDTSFAGHYPGQTQPLTASEGDAHAKYGSNLLPYEFKPASLNAPVFSYPYARSREALNRISRQGAPHACHGFKMQYANPTTGGYPMPTIAAFLQLLPAGFRGTPYRSTDATVYCVAEGSGRSRIGEETFEWTRSDVFVVPSWAPVSHECDGEALLFSFSDRPAQKALGIWRESAG